MTGSPEFIKAIPILPVRSVSASINFYCDKLSFEGHGMPAPPADPVFGSVFRGKNADVNLYLSKVDEGIPVHPQHVYIMIAGTVVPGGTTPEIDLLYDEMKGKGVFESAEADKPNDAQYSGFRQFDVVDLDGELLSLGTYQSRNL
jgi:catechol 2,3-dioxygenase-like lactoylglutathione lyase family enzyme